MQNPRLAARYAKSLIDIAQEQKTLEAVKADMELLAHICESNRDFVLMLKSPVVKADKKAAVIKAVLDGKVQQETQAFIRLLINKGREFYLPEMATAFADQYRNLKNIKTVQLTTAVAVDETLKSYIMGKVTESVKDGQIELKTSVDADLIGGFTLEIGDKLFDASIRRDLVDIKNQFTKNLYVASI
jgi:F-type H+-transporting ATPase subunit delta